MLFRIHQDNGIISLKNDRMNWIKWLNAFRLLCFIYDLQNFIKSLFIPSSITLYHWLPLIGICFLSYHLKTNSYDRYLILIKHRDDSKTHTKTWIIMSLELFSVKYDNTIKILTGEYQLNTNINLKICL